MGVLLHGVESGSNESSGRQLQTGGARVMYRLNTSECWSLAVEEGKVGTLLCLKEGPSLDPSPNPSSTTSLVRVDLVAGVNTTIGRFPEGGVCTNSAATYDSKAGVYYAYLSNDLTGLDGMSHAGQPVACDS